MVIKYLKHAAIDKSKWDECIANAHNSLIYVHSFYLDNCTGNSWDALMVGDYEFVMPLTFRKKYGIKYLHQPAFLQQSGIFSAQKINEDITNIFLAEIEKLFKFAEINLNYANCFVNKHNIQVIERNNFTLSLQNSYKNISSKFKNDFIKNLKRSKRYPLNYEKSDNVDFIIDMYKRLYGARFPSVKQKDYLSLKKNCNYLHNTNNLILRTIHLEGEIIAAIILLKDSNRLYNVASSITQKGRKMSANHFLYNKIIDEFSEQDLIFDFEGSDINGIADFYKSMGPINEKYISVKFNNLPWFVKLFKK